MSAEKPLTKETLCLDCEEVVVIKYLDKGGIYRGKSICKKCTKKYKRKYYGLA